MPAKVEPPRTQEMVEHLTFLVDTPEVYDAYRIVHAILMFARVNKYGPLPTRDVYEVIVRLMHRSGLRPFTYSTILGQLHSMRRGGAVNLTFGNTHGVPYLWLATRERSR